ncbi:hypothetical protein SOVF_004000 [Spinacia oleracea]|nr:hypothetical protein SOVF_004000 [Spinacia oleracea]
MMQENHHALHKRVDQLCTSAIKWTELKRKTKDVDMKVISFTQQGTFIYIMLANGVIISRVTLPQPDSTGGTLTD